MADLRRDVLNAHDLEPAVTWVARRMERHGLKVRVEDDGQPKPLDEDVLGAALRERTRTPVQRKKTPHQRRRN